MPCLTNLVVKSFSRCLQSKHQFGNNFNKLWPPGTLHVSMSSRTVVGLPVTYLSGKTSPSSLTASTDEHQTHQLSQQIQGAQTTNPVPVLLVQKSGFHHHAYFSNAAMFKDRRSQQLSCLKTGAISQPIWHQVRGKSKKKQVDSDDESDDDDVLDDDDFDAPPKFKVMKIHAASLRADTIISAALGVSRNKLEEAFFGPGMLLNGEKLLKKSVKMDEGDYIDLVLEKVEDQCRVKRVKIIREYPEKTTTGKSLVKVRVWKSPFLIAAPNRRR